MNDQDLFAHNECGENRPLADRMRPRTLEQFVGQSHIVSDSKPLRRAIEEDRLHSMIFWGPPGTGKTTLARLIAHHSGAQFLSLSAVLSGVKEIRAAVEQAKHFQQQAQRPTVLLIDAPHR